VLDLTPEELTAIKFSLRVATVATLTSLPFGVAAAMLIGRGRFLGRPLLNAIILLPLVLPPVVTGYVLLLLFGRHGPIGGWLADHFGIVFAFRWTGAALACAIMGFPLLVRAIQLSVEAVDQRLEQAASTLGASRVWVFLTVTLPLIAPGIIAGGILAFARSMGEFGATITFVSNIPGETQTLPSLIYTFTQVPGGDAGALRLTLISVAISLSAVLAAEVAAHFIGRRIRANA
jgi:molybdate transport system permease protein